MHVEQNIKPLSLGFGHQTCNTVQICVIEDARAGLQSLPEDAQSYGIHAPTVNPLKVGPTQISDESFVFGLVAYIDPLNTQGVPEPSWNALWTTVTNPREGPGDGGVV